MKDMAMMRPEDKWGYFPQLHTQYFFFPLHYSSCFKRGFLGCESFCTRDNDGDLYNLVFVRYCEQILSSKQMLTSWIDMTRPPSFLQAWVYLQKNKNKLQHSIIYLPLDQTISSGYSLACRPTFATDKKLASLLTITLLRLSGQHFPTYSIMSYLHPDTYFRTLVLYVLWLMNLPVSRRLVCS